MKFLLENGIPTALGVPREGREGVGLSAPGAMPGWSLLFAASSGPHLLPLHTFGSHMFSQLASLKLGLEALFSSRTLFFLMRFAKVESWGKWK